MKKKGTFGRKRKISQGKLHGITIYLVSSAMWILLLAVVIFVGILGAKKAYSFGYQVFADKQRMVDGQDVSITIGNDTNALAVGKQLEKNGIIDDAYVFYVQSILFDVDIQSGTYTVNTQDSSRAILEKFDKGPEESK